MSKFADEFQPGESLESIAILVTRDWNEQVLFAQQDYDPRYIASAEGGAAEVHPALLLAISANTRSPSYRLRPGTASVLAEDAVTFIRQASVDERLSVRNLMAELRSGDQAMGSVGGGPPPLGEADKKKFANSLDKILTQLSRGVKP